MPEVYITLEEAAAFKGVKYKTLAQRIKRSPTAFNTKLQPREGEGKEQAMISAASLSLKRVRRTKPRRK